MIKNVTEARRAAQTALVRYQDDANAHTGAEYEAARKTLRWFESDASHEFIEAERI